MAQSLWKIPDITNLRPPVTVLKEQASALIDQTKGILVGEVRTEPGNNQLNMQYTLDIVVPTLNNYRFRVLAVIQPLTMYPLVVSPSLGRTSQVNNEEELTKTLGDILSSDDLQRVLSSLMAQATSSSA